MRYISFDLETIPQETSTPAQIKQYSKKEPLIESKGFSENMIRSTDPFLGRILCIGMYYRDTVAEDTSHKALYKGSEKDILQEFWDILEKVDLNTKMVSFNGFNFDIPWIRIRSLVNGIKMGKRGMSYFFNINQFKNTPHVDLMVAIKGDKFLPNITVGLDLACDAFGIPTPKDGIDGSEVYKFYKDGRLNEIVEYVKRDVYSTGMLYEKMVNLGYLN